MNLGAIQCLALDQFQRYRFHRYLNVRRAQSFQRLKAQPVQPSVCFGGRVKITGNLPRLEFVRVLIRYGLLLPASGVDRFGQRPGKGTTDARGPILARCLDIPILIKRVYVGWWFHIAQIHATSELRIRANGYPPKRNTHQDGNDRMASFMRGCSFQFSLRVAFGHTIHIKHKRFSCQALFCLRSVLFRVKL
jgi:hypothetical protein